MLVPKNNPNVSRREGMFIRLDKRRYAQYRLKLLSYTVSKNSLAVTSPELRKHCPLCFQSACERYLRVESQPYPSALGLERQPAADSQNMLNVPASNSPLTLYARRHNT